MPIYEYRCEACGKVSEFHMKLSDPHPTECPACRQAQLKKIMSLPSFHLKGGGWYADAYDGKSNKKAASTGSQESASAPAADASKASGTTPAAAPAAAPSTPASSSGSDTKK